MEQTIRYGMVGGSIHHFIGEVHRKAIALDPRVQLVCGCFSTSADKNAETGELYALAADRIYPDWQTMAQQEGARPDGIDFVSITTPNHLHYSIAKAFLQAGIHVVCEKPLCFTVAQAEELQALAQDKNLLFAVTYAYTGYAMVKAARQMIQEGKIGRVIAVNAEYAQDWLLDELAPGQSSQGQNLAVWRTNPAISGSSNTVGDIGTHVENMLHYLTGLPIQRLFATIDHFGHELELNANILLEYEGNVHGSIWVSQVAAGHLNDLVVRIYGSQGSLQWQQESPDRLVYTPKDAPTQILGRGSGYLSGAAAEVNRLPTGHPEGLYVAFANIYRNVVSNLLCRKAGRQPTPQELDFPTVEDGLNGVRFVQAVVDSAAQGGAWVQLP